MIAGESVRECEKKNTRYRHLDLHLDNSRNRTGLDWAKKDYDYNRRRSLVGSYPQLPRMVDKNIRLIDWSAY